MMKTIMKKHFSRLILFGIISFCVMWGKAAYSYGADEGNYDTDYCATEYDDTNGLSSMEVNAIAQTSDGYIWIGTYSGLYRYNGLNFYRINLNSYINNVTSLYIDNQDNLWIGTNDNGVARYDIKTGECKMLTVDDGLPAQAIRSIAGDENGNVYLGTIGGIAVVDSDFIVKNLGEDFENMIIVDMQYYHEGIFYGITNDGKIIKIIKDKLEDISSFKGAAGEYYTSLYIDGDNIYAGTTQGDIVSVDPEDITRANIVCEIKAVGSLNFVKGNEEGTLFIGGTVGFGYIDSNKKFHTFHSDDFGNSVTDMISDYQGNLWFASSNQGVCKFSPNPFLEIFRKAGVGEKVINAIVCYDGNLYIGCDDGLVVLDKASNMPAFNRIGSLFDGIRIRGIMKDSHDNLWFSTYSSIGLVCVRPDGSYVNYTEDDGTIGGRFRCAIELKDGTIVAATSVGISYIRDGKVVKNVGEKEGLSMPQILSMLETDRGTLLLGSDGAGIYELEDGQIVDHKDATNGLEALVVLRIVPYQTGYVYVTSNGLYYDNGEYIKMLDRFPYHNNYDVIFTDDGLAWVTSSAGLFVVDAALLINNAKYNCVLLNNYDGLDASFTANSWNYIDEGNSFYLCCNDGVKKMDSNIFEFVRDDYMLTVGDIQIDDGDMNMIKTEDIEIPSSANRVAFYPAILNFTLTNPLVHIYMEGFDDVGITMYQNELTPISFTNIPNGDYVFHIQILDRLTRNVKKDMAINIHKEAKSYENPYFAIYLFLVICFVIFFFAWLIAKYGSYSLIKEQYEEVRLAKDEAEDANKAKSQFLAKMSHEIRTPINTILGMDELILNENTDNTNITGYAKDIKNAGESLLAIVNDILDYSKIQASKLKIVEEQYILSELLDEICSVLSVNGANKGLETLCHVDPKVPEHLIGDKLRVKQIMLNLVSNAVKYTNVGKVMLEVSLDHIEEDKAYIKFTVEDTGIGIRKEDLPKLCESFERIDEVNNRNVQGTGLGLSITQELLMLMGSELNIESEYQKGSVFGFIISQRYEGEEKIGAYEYRKATANKAYAGKEENDISAFETDTEKEYQALVVDDNSINIKLIRGLLKKTKYKCNWALSASECLKMIKKTKYDIILLDHMMPDMDGLETLKRIRESSNPNRHTPVVALTANVMDGAEQFYTESGFNGYLTKPVNGKVLVECMDSILNNNANNNLDGNSANELIERSVALEMCDGDEELVATILDVYAEEAEEKIAEIKGYFDSEDWYNYVIYVHEIKSASKSVGAMKVAELALALEMAGKKGDIEFIKANNNQLLEIIRQTKEAILNQ